MRRTSLTREQLLRNAEAMVALANDQPVQYFSPVLKKWANCECVDVEFEHRIRPTEGHSPACESGGDCPVCMTHGGEKSGKPTGQTSGTLILSPMPVSLNVADY